MKAYRSSAVGSVPEDLYGRQLVNQVVSGSYVY